MTEKPESARRGIAHLDGLKKQFEHLALKYTANRHIYVEYPHGSDRPIPFDDLDFSRSGSLWTATYESAHVVFRDGRWMRLGLPRNALGRNWSSWHEGDGMSEFEALASNVESFLMSSALRVPLPSEVKKLAEQFPFVPANSIILPCGPHRWARILHWLAWSGEVMPGSRLTWNGTDQPCEYSLDPSLKMSSIIDNLFLRSALAIGWIIGGLTSQTDVRILDSLVDRYRSEPSLTEEQRCLLVAALLLSAFDSDSRKTAEELVQRAKGTYADPFNAKKSLADMVYPKKLLESKGGRSGGYWLTPDGRSRAKKLNATKR